VLLAGGGCGKEEEEEVSRELEEEKVAWEPESKWEMEPAQDDGTAEGSGRAPQPPQSGPATEPETGPVIREVAPTFEPKEEKRRPKFDPKAEPESKWETRPAHSDETAQGTNGTSQPPGPGPATEPETGPTTGETAPTFEPKEEKHRPRFDPRAEKVLKEFSAHLKGLKTFRLELVSTVRLEAQGLKQEMETVQDVAVVRPDRLAILLKRGRACGMLVCDGQKLYTCLPMLKRYTVKRAPRGVAEVLNDREALLSVGGVGPVATFMPALTSRDPYKEIMEGVKRTEYLGIEGLEGVECHHLRAFQDDFDWEIWVEAGESPLIRKIVPGRSKGQRGLGARLAGAGRTKMECSLRLGSWQAGVEIPEALFTFTPPEDAKQSGSIFEGFEEWGPGELVEGTEGYEGVPIPAGPDARTAKHNREVNRKWHHRTSIDIYAKVGQTNEKWDAAAVRYLEKIAKMFAGTPDAPKAPELVPEGEALVKMGCTDPVVLYSHGAVLHFSDRPVDAEPFVLRALDLFQKSKYPKLHAYYAARRLLELGYRLQIGMEEGDEELFGLAMKLLGASAADDSYIGEERRILVDGLIGGLNGIYRHREEAIYKALRETPGADPWVVKVMGGFHHIKAAWRARGSGWAHTVTREGRLGFWEHLREARALLTEAWELEPTYPEAPSQMITVSMATGAETEPRLWFDRAVAGQLDHVDAYNKLLWALRPRWGGSHEEMHAFGLECLATERFDTDIPAMFLKALRYIGGDLPDSRDAYRWPNTHRGVSRVFEGMITEPTRAKERVWLKSQFAVLSWACEEYGKANELLEELGDQFPAEALQDHDVTLLALQGEARAFSSPVGEEIRRAERLRRKGLVSAALKILEPALDRHKDDEAISYAIRDRLLPIQVVAKMAAGEWARLTPAKDLAGWETSGGKWTVCRDGAIEGNSSAKKGMMLVFKAPIETDFELRAEVELVSTQADTLRGGMVLGFDQSGHYQVFANLWMTRDYNDVFLCRYFSGELVRGKAPIGSKNSVLVQVRGPAITVHVNDAAAFVERKLPDSWLCHPGGSIGLGAYYQARGTVVRYRDLAIRVLKNKAKSGGPRDSGAE